MWCAVVLWLELCVVRSGVVVRTDSQLREPSFRRQSYKSVPVSGRYVTEESSNSNCNVAENFPEKSSWLWNEQVCRVVKCKVL